jgi:hypothetical protein
MSSKILCQALQAFKKIENFNQKIEMRPRVPVSLLAQASSK